MMEIVAAFLGAVFGAFFACAFAYWQRNSDRWKSFQEEIGVIRAKILLTKAVPGIEDLAAVHRCSVNDVVMLVYRVRPYIFFDSNKVCLTKLLDSYRSAQNHNSSGFLAKDNAALYREGKLPSEMFSDPDQGRQYLTGLLDEMINV